MPNQELIDFVNGEIAKTQNSILDCDTEKVRFNLDIAAQEANILYLQGKIASVDLIIASLNKAIIDFQAIITILQV